MRLSRSYVILIVCWFTWFWSASCGNIITALMPAIQQSLSLSTSAVGLLIGANSLGGVIAYLGAGFFCARFGRRRVIIIGLAISALCLLFISFSTSYLYILITRTVLGFSIGLYLPAGISILSDIFPLEKIGRYIGIHEMANPAGQTIGPIFASLMLSLGLGWNESLQVWIIPTIIILISQLVFIREIKASAQEQKQPNEAAKTDEAATTSSRGGTAPLPNSCPLKYLLLLASAQILRNVAGSETSLMPVYWVTYFGVATSTAALVFGIVKIFAIFGQAGAGYMSDIFGCMKVLTVIQLISSLVLIPVSYLQFGPLQIVSLSIFSIFTNGYMPVMFALASSTCQSSKERLKVLGIIMACGNCANTVNPAILGFIVDKFSYGVAWVYPITTGFLSIPILTLSARKIKN